MCGIIGALCDQQQNFNFEAFPQALATLAHRGPNGTGQWQNQHCRLGHRRLSIIDLTPNSNQPFTRSDLGLTITFNGEIYNYKSLREQLQFHGYTFKTQSDTEVLLTAYHFYGRNVCAHLDGMFAFAIFDPQKKELFLARDPLGKKPLYYSFAAFPFYFIFASELKAIRPLLPEKSFINHESIDLYQTYGYIPEPQTIYKNIHALLPGHQATVNFGDTPATLTTQSYWSPRPHSHTHPPNLYEATEHLMTLFTQAVQKRMLASDVPVGAFLSGGIDSSAVVALASRYTQKLKTFTIKFHHDSSFDESLYARQIARQYQTEHSEFSIEECNPFSRIDQILSACDQPFADSSAIPTLMLAQKVAPHVRVALSGDGGDELFCGYERYRAAQFGESIGHIPAPLRHLALRLLRPYNHPKSRIYALKRLLKEADHSDPIRRYLGFIQYFPPNAQAGAYIEKIFHSLPPQVSLIDRLAQTDLRSYLPYDLLVKSDRMSMQHALEVRCPFLDRAVVEYALSLPASLKMVKGDLKGILKHAVFKSILPNQLMFRRKMGFAIPLHRLFNRENNSHFRMIVSEIIDSEIDPRIFNKDLFVKLIHEHEQNRENHTQRIWNQLILAKWLLRTPYSIF